MKVPLTWLETMLPGLRGALQACGASCDTSEATARAVGDVLDSLGLPVDTVTVLDGPPNDLVVARIDELSPVEGSDHLHVARVTVDDGPQRQVVCGAPNAKVGMLTVYAPVGSTPPGLGATVERKAVRGVDSDGVLCSPREAGLYDDGSGVCVLGNDVNVGARIADHWQAEVVLDLEITPNRADAFSILGVARDLAAKLEIELAPPHGLELPAPGTAVTVKLDDPVACPRFTARSIDGVVVAPSPVWLQRRLASVGLRPRNNIVDVTNFVTFELGQPSHAYDRRRLKDDTIGVRRAKAGETLLTLLDDEPRKLDPDDVVIATGAGLDEVVGLAGVVGGGEHSVEPDTTSIVLEVAHFDTVAIYRMAKRHRLITDAQYRFERGVDPDLPALASSRAAQLIGEVASDPDTAPTVTDLAGFVDQGGAPEEKHPIAFRPARVAFLVDVVVPDSQQKTYLEAIGCKVADGPEAWAVVPPSWRFDLAIEEDLIEEVARLHGYDHIPETIPAMDFVPTGEDVTHRSLRALLAGMGMQEVITYIFTSDDELAKAGAPKSHIHLAHPPAAERSVLRTALLPSLLNVTRNNKAAERVALFEVGHVYGETEVERLGIVLRGAWRPGHWLKAEQADFFLFKGLLEQLASTLGATLSLAPLGDEAATALPFPEAGLHPGVAARVMWNGRAVGIAGRVHPGIETAYELGGAPTFVAEIDLPLEPGRVAFADPPRQPHADRDVAIVADDRVAYLTLASLVRDAAGERLEAVTPFDVYVGKPIPEGKRSVALRLRFRHPDRALTEEEIDTDFSRVIAAIEKAGYEVRAQS